MSLPNGIIFAYGNNLIVKLSFIDGEVGHSGWSPKFIALRSLEEKDVLSRKKMDVESVMVTGANRGIGLEFVRQLVKLNKPPKFVFATYRSETAVQALKKIKDESEQTEVVLIKMDVRSLNDIENAQKIIEEKVGDKGLNLLINNAGVMKFEGFPEITEEDFLFHFTTNTIAPVIVLKKMLPLLQRAAAHKTTGMSVSRAAVLNLSSELAAISTAMNEFFREFPPVMGYSVSKIAMNMAMRKAAFTVQEQGILVVNMCPGWVKTDMGTEHALLEVSESVSDMMKTLPELNESHHGSHLDRNGKVVPF
ncbi:putative oxidoreductase C663.08c [Araneus ventricosus]|uniref:Putative oxidoreductase C663.08c n=1 Tax=Araneus ventricosus TaxID=182803 RepID=A0A4Y2C7F4_ARAVE|nr:putative oxidoreductase C663.08c [Araneus ventricosus]